MAPKKKAPAADAAKAEEDDNSTELLWKAYKKNCQMLEITPNKRLKEMYDVDWVEDRKHFTKVSS